MKQITYEEKQQAAKEYADLKAEQACGGMNDSNHLIIRFAHMAGQDYAKEQLKPEWIPVDGNHHGILEGVPDNRVVFLFENGLMRRLNESPPREVIVGVFILPEPPKQ